MKWIALMAVAAAALASVGGGSAARPKFSARVDNIWFPLRPDTVSQDGKGNVWYFGESPAALLTKEWTPLEPDVVDHKFYVRGVGTVLEQTVRGGNERNELISVSH
jgi:hypothetical protein